MVRVGRFRGRHFERRNTVDILSANLQNFAACRQDRNVRTLPNEHFGQVRHRIDDVLAVVEHEQKLATADGTRKGAGGNPLSADLQAE